MDREARPMLAVNAEARALRFPCLGSPKLDGVRALVVGGRVLSRSGLPIPNEHVQRRFGRPELEGVDGELILGSPTDAATGRLTNGAVARAKGEPDVKLYAFDLHDRPGTYAGRLEELRRIVAGAEHVGLVPQQELADLRALAVFEDATVRAGFEGVMLRRPDAPYKHGRSTLNEGYLLKVKRWMDSEAVLLGVNREEGRDAVASFRGRDVRTDVEFDASVSNLPMAEREALWSRRDSLDRVFTYRSYPHGVKDKPKSPQFVDFRHGWNR